MDTRNSSIIFGGKSLLRLLIVGFVLSLPAEFGQGADRQNSNTWHPRHKIRTWKVLYIDRHFHVVQMPRCEHIETIIAYEPRGQTLARAKRGLNGIAACTGSFHHPRTMAVADFLQKNGSIFASARTGRHFLAIMEGGSLKITDNYGLLKGKDGVSAIALGQRLVPLQRDGFSVKFMNKVTDRMAIGMNDNFIYIVRTKSDVWRLARYMKQGLHCKSAINADGGHVVNGKAPVHLVFRWDTSKDRWTDD